MSYDAGTQQIFYATRDPVGEAGDLYVADFDGSGSLGVPERVGPLDPDWTAMAYASDLKQMFFRAGLDFDVETLRARDFDAASPDSAVGIYGESVLGGMPEFTTAMSYDEASERLYYVTCPHASCDSFELRVKDFDGTSDIFPSDDYSVLKAFAPATDGAVWTSMSLRYATEPDTPPSTIPLPGSLPLIASAFGLTGVLRWRAQRLTTRR